MTRALDKKAFTSTVRALRRELDAKINCSMNYLQADKRTATINCGPGPDGRKLAEQIMPHPGFQRLLEAYRATAVHGVERAKHIIRLNW